MTEPRLVGGRYEIGDLIGYGGMAEVYIGRDVRLGRQVALKILRSDLAREKSFQTRFRREAQSAGGLNHPAIVAVYDSGEDTGPDGAVVPYIVMEFVDGRTLRDILVSEKRLDPSWAMEVVGEVCAALDFSHRAGIIHRDIKPANVMITKHGAVKVMDFGIARALADDAATVTQTAAVIGTAQYLSPEQARGEPVDARSDVYSTGCLLYELVVGHPPFLGDSPVAVAYQHVRETAAVPSSVNPAVPRALDSIIMKALAKNPLNRYQTAAEMRSDVQRALADSPVRAEPVLSDDERTQLIAGAAATPTSHTAAGEPNHSRRGALLWVAAVVALLLIIGIAAWALLRNNNDDKTAPPATTAVPNLIGVAADRVESVLQSKQLVLDGTPEQVNACANTTVVAGTVCTQSPDPDTVVNVGSKITVTIYAGPKMVTVPSMVNTQFQDASSQLVALGLKVEPNPVSSNQPSGTVLAQSVQAGTSVPVGTAVKLDYSSGQLAIVDVTDQANFLSAKQKLNNAGFLNVAADPVTDPNTDPARNGKPSRTDPAAGTLVDPSVNGPKITIYVYANAPVVTCVTPTPTPTGTPPVTPTPTPSCTTTTP